MSQLSLLDWRRQVAAAYRVVRDAGDDDAEAAHARWRALRDDLFRHHPDSPLTAEARARFGGLPIARYDPALRFEAEVDRDPAVPPARIEVPTGTDGIVGFERIGRVTLGTLGSLDVWWLASYGGGLFVPVKDALAGTKTYGGGRYLIDTVKGADLGGTGGRLVLDLNFAYNPSCAYDPAWACPLAPPGNVLAEPVLAGELMAPD
ncbi:MAG: DUF1684 domain-containing protein [Actinomycetota bacterium]|nr:DUF1684 domain-containing protein [Actinomycetota bacterium]